MAVRAAGWRYGRFSCFGRIKSYTLHGHYLGNPAAIGGFYEVPAVLRVVGVVWITRGGFGTTAIGCTREDPAFNRVNKTLRSRCFEQWSQTKRVANRHPRRHSRLIREVFVVRVHPCDFEMKKTPEMKGGPSPGGSLSVHVCSGVLFNRRSAGDLIPDQDERGLMAARQSSESTV